MALAAGLAELHAQACCPLCQGPLCEPLTLDCGHNCCSACLQQRWQHLQEPLPCPVCQHPCPHGPRGTNTQLAQLADLVSRLPGPRPEGHALEARGRCAVHLQPLSLFCEDHLELLCDQCGASAAHRGHRLTPIGAAAAHHRTKLKGYLEPLRKQLQEAQRAREQQILKRDELREELEKQRSELYWELKEFKDCLRSEQNIFDITEENHMRAVFQEGIRSRKQLSALSSTLRAALWDLTQLHLQADQNLLAGVREAQLQRSRWDSAELPATFVYRPTQQIRTFPPHHIGLQNILSRFQVDVTLDPETAHSSLLVSPDRRRVVYCPEMLVMQLGRAPPPNTPLSHVAVMGAQGFQGGRHFWQVEISGMGMWSIGVCEDTPRNAPNTPSPERGFWELILMTRHHLDSLPEQTLVGIFLDYDLGQVSFYNMYNRSHFHTITDTWTGRLLPYFSVGTASSMFSLSVVRDEC
ncbi:tripartite motif-containing protein 75-like [Sorex araneus]|uniref:tripartite motif-containing protein 75-like n=1 Tax=Sorex araneus TaxID=42254 RepID=UPI0024336755|nr:tripartite motif-containing protein 75-like [Sorex araneus]